MTVAEIIRILKELGDPSNVEGMKKAGITPVTTWGVRVPRLRELAKNIGTDHELALELWGIDCRETRILASMIADPRKATSTLIDEWTSRFDYWEICDQCCMNLFEKTPFAGEKAIAYSGRPEEYVKRTGFVLMARLAVSDKNAPDDFFETFLPLIKREADDGRPMVKKAVNWALRQIGKRNLRLHSRCCDLAREIMKSDSKAARWVASDALRELTSEAVRQRLEKRGV